MINSKLLPQRTGGPSSLHVLLCIWVWVGCVVHYRESHLLHTPWRGIREHPACTLRTIAQCLGDIREITGVPRSQIHVSPPLNLCALPLQICSAIHPSRQHRRPLSLRPVEFLRISEHAIKNFDFVKTYLCPNIYRKLLYFTVINLLHKRLLMNWRVLHIGTIGSHWYTYYHIINMTRKIIQALCVTN